MSKSNVLYSVRMRRGLDVEHYDIVFGEHYIELIYLGEYWEKGRPVTGLQRRQDLLLYKLVKARRRRTMERVTRIDYCSVSDYQLLKPRGIEGREGEAAGRGDDWPRLVLVLADGARIEVEIHPKAYRIAKSLVRNILRRRIDECRSGRRL
ncbi:MAG: hypothetical protein DSY37_04640 [Hyperthermus sp.]|nr:MAG: hypothetical protein DSY37_04640 [Hyperthermus sp.]